MIEMHYYWQVLDSQKKEVSPEPIKAEYRGGMHHIPQNALQSEPLKPKSGFAVIATDDFSGTTYIVDHRGKTVWNQSDCTQSKQVSELGDIEVDWTLLKPNTSFDEWIGSAWVTNLGNQYIFNYNQVDEARRRVYIDVINPLELEAQRKERQGDTAIAEDYYRQADAAKVEMEKAHPWPVQPT